MTNLHSDPARVIGIDPSLTCTGIATADGCESIETKPEQWQGNDLGRLLHIAHSIYIAAHDADAELAVLEDVAFSRNTGKASDRAGLHWLIRNLLHQAGIPVAIVKPNTRAKYATGKGNAGKDTVLIEVVRRLPIQVLNNNEADAAVLLAMGLDHFGQPMVTMPATHRAALEAVTWPSLEVSA